MVLKKEQKCLAVQYDVLFARLSLLPVKKKSELVLVNYILDIENQNELVWQEKGKNMLAQEMGY